MGSERPHEPLSNLPLSLTSFIGRKRELAEIKSLLRSTRLLTLTGPGGCGTTRLALAVADELIAEFEDGVWLVELAALNDLALVPQTVAAALGLRERTSGTFNQALTDYLHTKNLLLVLDNCEHLIDACAQLTDALLQHCPELKILATSRESLNVAGEIAWLVPSLALPSPSQLDEPDALFEYEAIRLFGERAHAVVPQFSLTRENARAVVEVCRQLDGIPLAIELAAVRVKVLSVQQLAARFDDRLNLLAGGIRTALPRHQTLRATMDWSYELLSEQERVLLQRLSVFLGGWPLEAAETVCAGAVIEQAEVLGLLLHLVDKSLIEMKPNGEARYRMLETIRQYAQEKLRNTHAADQVRIRHLEYYLGWVEQAEPKLHGSEQIEWLKRLDRERDNLRLALEWSLSDEADFTLLQVGLQLAAALWRFWFMRGDLYEGRRWLELALARSGPLVRSKRRAQLLNAAGCLAWLQGDFAIGQAWLEESDEISQEVGAKRERAYALDWRAMIEGELGHLDTAQELATKSVELFREVNDPWGEAHSLFALGRTWLRRCADATARPYYDESLTLFRELGDKWGIGLVIGHLGMIAEHHGDYAAARAMLEQRLALAREIGSKQLTAVALYHLGLIAHYSHDHEHATELFKEYLNLSQQIGLGHSHSLAASFSGLALVAGAAGQWARAARLFAAADAVREKTGVTRAPAEQQKYDRGLALVRAQLSQKAFAAAWLEGRATPLKQAIAYALETIVEREQARTARQVEKQRYKGFSKVRLGDE